MYPFLVTSLPRNARTQTLQAGPSLRLGRLKVISQTRWPILVRVRTQPIQMELNPSLPLHNHKGKRLSPKPVLMTILYRVSDSDQSLPMRRLLLRRLGEAWLHHPYRALSAL